MPTTGTCVIRASAWREGRPSGRCMLRLQRVVSGDPEAGNSDMHDRNPALDLVMSNAMHPVGKADRCSSSGYFEGSEPGGIVDYVIRNQNFFPSASLKVPGGGVVEATKDPDAGEKQNVGPVPEGMGRQGRLGRGTGRRNVCFGGRLTRLRRCGLLSGRNGNKPACDQQGPKSESAEGQFTEHATL